MNGYNKGTFNHTDMSTFPTITLQDIKRHGTNAFPKRQVAYLIVNSKKHSVVVPIEDYEALMEMIEDFDDARVIEERRNEPDISWEEFFGKKKKRK